MAFRARSHHHLRVEPENKLNSNACDEAYMKVLNMLKKKMRLNFIGKLIKAFQRLRI